MQFCCFVVQFSKIQDGGGRQFEKFCFNGRNTAIFAHICTKFCMGTQNHVLETSMPSDLTSDKIQDDGGRHFEILL